MKIGFLAMSGLRVCDPKLLELGMTLPGIVERGRVLQSLPSLGLLYLAAYTPDRHEVFYFEAHRDGTEPRELYELDLVAINTFSAQAPEAYAVADRLRAAGVRVAMGGLHVSVMPQEALNHADYVFVGEGEETWHRFVEAIELGKAPRTWNAADFPPVDVQELRVPRYDLLPSGKYARLPVQATRGCPWRCDFCASNVMLNQPYRRRRVEDVVRDIRVALTHHPRAFIEFADDNTFVDHQWGRQLCRELAPLGVKWFTETDISVGDDPQLLRLMREARCRQVLIGLESPDQSSLEGVELRADFKHRRATHYVETIRRIQEAGITVNGCFILGLDKHTPEIFDRVLEFANRVPLYDVQITILTPFPGTPLYDRLQREGRLIAAGQWERCTLFDVNFTPAGMTVGQLQEGIAGLAESLYSEAGQMARRRGFYDPLWAGRSSGG